MYKKILVAKLRHIGDVLLSTPVFQHLKEKFPHSQICTVVNRGTEEVLKNNPYVDKIFPYDRAIKELPLRSRVKCELNFLFSLYRERFDVSIDLTGGDRAAIYSFLVARKLRVGFIERGFLGKRYLYTHRKSPNWNSHFVLMNLELLSFLGIEINNPEVKLYLDPEEKKWAQNLLKSLWGNDSLSQKSPIVHIHPTARWLYKCWKDEYMAEIIMWLHSQGNRVIITSSAAHEEIGRIRKILSFIPSDIVLEPVLKEGNLVVPDSGRNSSGILNLSGRITLRQLIALSSLADIYFGIDTGPMHIAAALGKPVIALFGPSSAKNWGPWDNQASGEPYTKDRGVQKYGKNLVIQRDWDCIPCRKDGCGGSKLSKCLLDIKPDEVKEILSDYMIRLRAEKFDTTET